MKHLGEPTVLLGVWSFNAAGFLVHSLPYLQFISLILAIAMSMVSLKKMLKDKKHK